MSGQFSGFSEDDIKKLKGFSIKQSTTTQKKLLQKKKQLTISQNNTTKSNIPVIFPDISSDSFFKNDTTINETESEQIKLKKSDMLSSPSTDLNEPPKVLDLDEFQKEQKRMEEENRRRKELLSKALADRTKKTTEEAQKLDTIQRELQKIDSCVSNDISILRNQIELTSIEFMQCQKNFERIEKEYLTVQALLKKKLEMKNLLTQHLCTIIQQNEMRKAAKLSQLMRDLDLSSINFTEENLNNN